jgi:hypothetical protein
VLEFTPSFHDVLVAINHSGKSDVVLSQCADLSSNAPTCGFTDKEDGLVTVSTVERKDRIL